MKPIPLTRGQYATVDNWAYPLLIAMGKWSMNDAGYAVRRHEVQPGVIKQVRMHRVVWQLAGRRLPKQIDHKNQKKLDNRLRNLRLGTKSLNQANSWNPRNTSGYRGVCWDRSRKLWIASIKIGYQSHHLGRFATARKAAIVYDYYADLYFGEYANLNFKKPQPLLASRLQRAAQYRTRRTNTSGHRGVAWIKKSRKWVAYIRMGGKQIVLGRFKRKQDAVVARLNAEEHKGVLREVA